MTETDPDDQSDDCEQCGLCCRIFGNSITPTVMNLYSWIEQGRTDILRHFSAVKEDGTRVNCADLLPEDLGSVVLIEMRDPRTGEYPTVCPFLQRIQKRKVPLRYPPGKTGDVPELPAVDMGRDVFWAL